MSLPLAIPIPGPFEWAVILIIALLLFGRRLPEVMRSMGRGVVEFKKGLKGVQDEIDDVGTSVNQPAESDSERKISSSVDE